MKLTFTLLATLFFMYAQSQTKAAKFSKDHPVKSVEWGSMSVMLLDGFWEMARPQLEKNFTKKMVDSLVNYSMSMYQPASFEYKRDSLKMYMVATFDNNFGGKFHGVECMIMVPYRENQHLWKNETTRPTDFFLIFYKDAVEFEK